MNPQTATKTANTANTDENLAKPAILATEKKRIKIEKLVVDSKNRDLDDKIVKKLIGAFTTKTVGCVSFSINYSEMNNFRFRWN